MTRVNWYKPYSSPVNLHPIRTPGPIRGAYTKRRPGKTIHPARGFAVTIWPTTSSSSSSFNFLGVVWPLSSTLPSLYESPSNTTADQRNYCTLPSSASSLPFPSLHFSLPITLTSGSWACMLDKSDAAGCFACPLATT